jgi:hypothetical protein
MTFYKILVFNGLPPARIIGIRWNMTTLHAAKDAYFTAAPFIVDYWTYSVERSSGRMGERSSVVSSCWETV